VALSTFSLLLELIYRKLDGCAFLSLLKFYFVFSRLRVCYKIDLQSNNQKRGMTVTSVIV
jgi:hypothetical protein